MCLVDRSLEEDLRAAYASIFRLIHDAKPASFCLPLTLRKEEGTFSERIFLKTMANELVLHIRGMLICKPRPEVPRQCDSL